MTKTDLIIKYMGITAYLDMMEKEIKSKIDTYNSKITEYTIKVVEARKKSKKKKYYDPTVSLYERELNDLTDKKTDYSNKLETIKTITQKLVKILIENNNKEEIPDGIFENLFKLSDLSL